MERRRFISGCLAAGLARALGQPAYGTESGLSADGGSWPGGLLIADPHAHPYQLHGSRSYDRSTPTLATMRQAGMTLCAFAAVGDMTFHRGRSGTPFSDTLNQLEQVKRLEEKGELKLVTTSAHLQSLGVSRSIHGLMAIEGGDALGQLKSLDAFHDLGVRMITVMHERDNEIGFNQRSSSDGPLTPFGVQVIERMNALGMVVDVAHAKIGTLESIADVCATPLIDSHTSVSLSGEERQESRRLRSWKEMERVARTGGVVCSWPYAYSGKRSERTTLRHWAAEIAHMKERLGIEHCGLGTDGGGGLPSVVKGWESIVSLPGLVAAMREAGLTQDDVAAFVGGNFLRVLGKCLM